jgi:hypothetical protein
VEELYKEAIEYDMDRIEQGYDVRLAALAPRLWLLLLVSELALPATE